MPRPGQPDIDDARFFQAIERSNAMQNQRGDKHPKRFEDQEQLGCQHGIDDKKAIGNAYKHLWPR